MQQRGRAGDGYATVPEGEPCVRSFGATGTGRAKVRTMRTALALLLGFATALGGCASAGPPPLGSPLGDGGLRLPGSPAEPGPEADLANRFAGGVSWPDVARAVLDRNPSVEAARARWRAALEKHPQAITLPDPMVEFTYYTRNAQTPDGPRRLDTMLRQPIPNPVGIALKGDLALREAEMARLQYDAALRDAVVEARDSCLELAYLDRAREVAETQREVLARYATVAAGDLGIGRTRLPEEIRARSLLAQAGYDLVLLADLRRAEEQRLRGLLRLPPGSALGPASAEDPPEFLVPLDAVFRAAETRSQEVAMAGVSVDMAGIEVSMAKWEYAPEFEVGGLWMRNEMLDPMGRAMDSRAVLFGLSVPIWANARSARVREAEALEAAAGADRAAAVERVRTAATRLYYRIVNAERLLALYRESLLPQAEKSIRLAEALYREGSGSLVGAVEAAVARENILLAYHRAVADRGQALARLEQVVGATFGGTPAAAGGGGR